MRVVLFGCGMMGRSAALRLSMIPELEGLVLIDRDPERVRHLAHWLDGKSEGRIETGTDLERFLPGSDVVAMSAPWDATRTAILMTLAGGVPTVSITRPPAGDLPTVRQAAAASSSPLLFPVGLEPGLSEMLAVHVIEQLDYVESLDILCGGVLRRPRGPLGYTPLFGGDQLPIGQRDAVMLRKGRPVCVPRFSGTQTVRVEGVGKLEAFHDGMTPWLAEHPALHSANASQKSLRWPGFAAAVLELARLGLLDERPVDVDGVAVIPKRVVERVLAPRVAPRPGDEDLVILEVTACGFVGGTRRRLRTTLRDTFDPDSSLTAMARTTGFTLAACAHLLAAGAITGTGWLCPPVAVVGVTFRKLMDELVGQGIDWLPAQQVGLADLGESTVLAAAEAAQ